MASEISDSDKILIYANGYTYWIDASLIYDPFPEEKKENERPNES